MENKEKGSHGGNRPGSGRPALDKIYKEEIIRTTVRLPESFYIHVKNVGDGDFSEGLRKLISQDMEGK